MKAKFITLEGGEGVGKTTNILFIKDFLEKNRQPVIITREPGGTEIAEKIRNLLLENHDEPFSEVTELLLIFAARAQHLKNVIQPALKQGNWVICDRFTDASYAYQGSGQGLQDSDIAQLETLVVGPHQPDCVFIFDLPIAMLMERVKSRIADLSGLRRGHVSILLLVKPR